MVEPVFVDVYKGIIIRGFLNGDAKWISQPSARWTIQVNIVRGSQILRGVNHHSFQDATSMEVPTPFWLHQDLPTLTKQVQTAHLPLKPSKPKR